MSEEPTSGLRRSRFFSAARDHNEQDAESDTKTYELVFSASQQEPPFAELFLATGGSIDSASARGTTSFSLTYSTHSAFHDLGADPVEVRLPLPDELVRFKDGALLVHPRTTLNVSTQRCGAAINGTLVNSHAGAGSLSLAHVLHARDTHTQLPLLYGTSSSLSAVLGLSNARIECACSERVFAEMDVEVEEEDEEEKETLEAAEVALDQYARGAWDLRQNHLKYALLGLTKTVCHDVPGVNGKNYSLVHDMLDAPFAFSNACLDSMLQHAIGVDLQFDDEVVQEFLRRTSEPSVDAASWTQTVAAACSSLASFLVAYRADGRAVCGAAGMQFSSTESWLRAPMRTPLDANDCDGSALLICSILNTIQAMPDDEARKYPWILATRNAVFPFYTPAISVVGAKSAEASNAHASEGHSGNIAGHAVAVLLPTASLLNALDVGAHKIVGGKAVEDPKKLRDARFAACFHEEAIAGLPPHEREFLQQGVAAFDTHSKTGNDIQNLAPYAMEGTTPASPVLYIVDDERRAQLSRDAARDGAALSRAAPNVARSYKMLHTGGHSKTDPHRFYHSFVEATVHPNHPLYKDPTLRKMGVAATQFVLGARESSSHFSRAGATPRELQLHSYAATPLCALDARKAAVLDYASSEARKNVVAPRRGPYVLSKDESRCLNESMAALKKLDNSMSKSKEAPGHCVAYTFAFSTLVNNPRAVEHFCASVQRCATAGVVDSKPVVGLCADAEGRERGEFVVVNVLVEV